MKILRAFLYQVGALFCLSSFLIGMSHASQKVVVTSSKALIYADKDLTLPIGFVSFGRELTVGEVTRKGGNILPLIVSGKIVNCLLSVIGTLEHDGKNNAPQLHVNNSRNFLLFMLYFIF